MMTGKKILINKNMRLSSNQIVKNMVSTKLFLRDQFIQPVFIKEGETSSSRISGLGKNKSLCKDDILKQFENDIIKGCRNFILFIIPEKKSDEIFDKSFSNEILLLIKNEFKDEIQLWVDLCICSRTRSGHCCLYKDKKIDFELSLKVMSELALSYVESGADGIAPSSMLKGVVSKIRSTLDLNNFNQVPIMSYSTKFASNFYGPFREAADSTPQFGDRSDYQLDFKSRSEAIDSSIRYANEGADLLMVKPGLLSLDLIKPIIEKTKKQVGAYQVSGEYASLIQLAKDNLINYEKALLETWFTLKRAGAQFIITYAARNAKELGFDK
jgi:porphobilinogen synthase|tara:strand:+ start:5491 stop:6471 length:981 start_codon:yes stop_codon:yes gene_type:complete